MTNRDNEAAGLTWTPKKVWGAIGLTHYATAMAGDHEWKFTVDQPTKGWWILRGWAGGKLSRYEEHHSQREAKAAAALLVRQLNREGK